MSHSDQEIGGEWGSGSYILIPEGEYVFVKVVKAKATTAQSGNPINDLEVEVIAGEYQGAKINDRTVLNYPSNSDPNFFPNKKRRWFQESADVEFRTNQTPEEVERLLLGKMLWVKTGQRESGKGDGKMYNSIVGSHPNFPCKGWQPPSMSGDGRPSGQPSSDDVQLDPDIDLAEDENFFVD